MDALTDLDEMPAGPHRGRIMRNVPANHLLGLLDTGDEFLDKYPAVKGYILNAIRQLRAEVHPPATNGDHSITGAEAPDFQSGEEAPLHR